MAKKLDLQGYETLKQLSDKIDTLKYQKIQRAKDYKSGLNKPPQINFYYMNFRISDIGSMSYDNLKSVAIPAIENRLEVNKYSLNNSEFELIYNETCLEYYELYNSLLDGIESTIKDFNENIKTLYDSLPKVIQDNIKLNIQITPFIDFDITTVDKEIQKYKKECFDYKVAIKTFSEALENTNKLLIYG